MSRFILFTTDNTWEQPINVVVNLLMKIMDFMWSLKLPATDIPVFVLWILGAIINIILLLLNSTRGLSSVSKQSLNASHTISSGVKNTIKRPNNRVEKKKVDKND